MIPRQLRPLGIRCFEDMRVLRSGFLATQNVKISFMMQTYEVEDVELPCRTIKVVNINDIDITEWLQNSAADVVQHMHLPSWRLLIVQSIDRVDILIGLLHALYDAHTLHMILNDFTTALNGEKLPRSVPFDSALAQIISGSTISSTALNYWKERGKRVNVCRMPSLTPLQVTDTSFGTLARSCTLSLEDVGIRCQQANVTIQAAAQAAWARILSAYIGESSVTFGVTYSGRLLELHENVPFPCITTLPITLSADVENSTLLREAMDYNVSVQRYQYTPLVEIQKILGYADQLLFDTLFVYQADLGSVFKENQWEIVDERATSEVSCSSFTHIN